MTRWPTRFDSHVCATPSAPVAIEMAIMPSHEPRQQRRVALAGSPCRAPRAAGTARSCSSPAESAMSASTAAQPRPVGPEQRARCARCRWAGLHAAHRIAGIVDYFNYLGRGDRGVVGGRGDLVEDAGQAVGERRPREARARRRGARRRPRRRRSLGSVDACDERAGQRAPRRRARRASPSRPSRRRCRPGPKRSTAIAGSPQAIALDEHRAELLAHRGEHDGVGGARRSSGSVVVLVPAGEEDVARAGRARSRRRGARPPTRPGGRRRGRATRAAARARSRARAKARIEQRRCA